MDNALQGLSEQLLYFALLLVRPLGTVIWLPLFSYFSQGGGMLIRNAIILAITLPLLPQHLDRKKTYVFSELLSWVELCTTELLIGGWIGFSIALSFWAVDTAGALIDTLRGATLSSVLNPVLPIETSLYGSLFSILYATAFLSLGGLNLLLSALYESYHYLPFGMSFQFQPAIINFIAHQWHILFELFIKFALPSIFIMVLIDISFGFLNRIAQQLNVFFLTMPIKSLVVLIMLIMSVESGIGITLASLTRMLERQNWLLAAERL